MFSKPWVRMLVFALVTVLVLGAVGTVAFRAGYRVGAQSSQPYAMPFGFRQWSSRQGNSPVVPSPMDGDQAQPYMPRMFSGQPGFSGRMPYHMGYTSFHRGWSPYLGWFWPGLLVGLIVLGGLTFLLVRAFNKPAEVAEAKPARKRTTKK